MTARTAFIALDACDVHVALRFAREGHMPVLARLLDTAAVQETFGPLGFFVGGIWATSWSGLSPARHRFLCPGQVRGGTYEAFWAGPVRERSVWNAVSETGGRVAVLDAPHSTTFGEINGLFISEWGGHDRHHPETVSVPESFLPEVLATFGPHPVGSWKAPRVHASPCDYKHRAGQYRTIEEEQLLFADICEGGRLKTELSANVLDREHWDLFYTVFGETHCVGHQLWKHHDTKHRQHDAGAMARLGGDPLLRVYSDLDRSIGELVTKAGPDATVYVNFSHGMRSHYDGTCLLDPVLWRLDEYVSGLDERGAFSRAVDSAVNAVPRPACTRALASIFDARKRLESRSGPIVTDGRTVDIPSWGGRRRWWMQPNDSVHGVIRLNLEGRESSPRVRREHKGAIEGWLADRLLELVNVETGAPAVLKVHFTDDHYPRTPDDPMGDLIIEWNRDAPLETVWSPATGVVTAPYGEWRTGDHHPEGLLLVQGPGIAPGVRPNAIPVMDIAPTIAASLDIDMGDVDGIARADLLPAYAKPVRASITVRRPRLSDAPVARRTPRRWAKTYDLPLDRWNENFTVGLSEALHGTSVELQRAKDALAAMNDRVVTLQQLASIAEVGVWLRHIEVPETLLLSVIVPTRNRAELMERAVESVRRQSYGNWELLIVDDASTDDTWARIEKIAAGDARIRPFHFDTQQRSSGARNHALDHAAGDVIAYIDDDNRMDPDWLRAVAWAFTEYPETRVVYGARVVDDDVRHRGYEGRSLPFVQFLEWDREAMLDVCRVDQSVIAHRPSDARLFESDQFSDWDLMLQLTKDCEPFVLPAIAVHYYSDAPNRVTDIARATGTEAGLIDLVRAREAERQRNR